MSLNETWREVLNLMEQAAEIPEASRRAFLEEQCRGQPEKLEKVLKYLDYDPDTDGILETSPVLRMRREQERWEAAVLEDLGRLANLRLSQMLGMGGMGRVYLAIDTDTGRRVALKMMRPEYGQEALRPWFQVECRLLARMNHKHIAQIFQVGYTPQLNAPFFLMEYVEGMRLDRFLETDQPLSVRLDLFNQICSGMAHAHQKQVIHRDLKPSNILIRDENGTYVAKIIDFGVARVVGDDEEKVNLSQDEGQMVGTPVYSSPEQFSGDYGQIDQQTDVYGLGAVLYALLTGLPPYDVVELESLSPDERGRRLCREDPLPPSRRRRLLGIREPLSRELDSITMKAMSKDKGHRYPAVASLLEDLRRFQVGEPVLAHPDSNWYQWRKFIKRRRYQVLTVVGVILVTVLAFVSMARSYDQASAARKQAVAVNGMLERILTSPRAEEKGKSLTVLEMIADAGKVIETSADYEPAAKADLHRIVGQTVYQLGDYGLACDHFETAYQLRKQTLGRDDPASLEVLIRLALVLRDSGELDVAVGLLSEATVRATAQDLPHLELEGLSGLAECLRLEGDVQSALPLLSEVVNRSWPAEGEQDFHALIAVRRLGGALAVAGQPQWGGMLLEDALTLQQETLGKDAFQTMLTRNELLHVQMFHDDLEKVASTYAEHWARMTSALGESHPYTLAAQYGWCRTAYLLGRYAQVEGPLDRLVQYRLEIHGGDHVLTVNAQILQALVLAKNGKLLRASALLRPIYDRRVGRWGKLNNTVLETAVNLADIYLQSGDFQSAASLLQTHLEAGAGKTTTMAMLLSRCTYGEALLGMNRPSEALKTFEVLLDEAEPILGKEHDYYHYFNACHAYASALMGAPNGLSRLQQSRGLLFKSKSLSDRVMNMVQHLEQR